MTPVTSAVAGLDVGGTKAHVRVERLDRHVLADTVHEPHGLRPVPYPQRVDDLAGLLATHVPPGVRLAALAVGAHGCDTVEQCEALRAALEARLGVPCTAVNDAELVIPAAGLTHGIGVIAGTGAIAVGAASDGQRLWAGSGGWLIGDDGGAFGLVRAAARAVLLERDAGRSDDPLVPMLLGALGIDDASELSATLTAMAPVTWAGLAPIVFSAVEQGSVAAVAVVRTSARRLGDLVAMLAARGAVADRVVAAGGVITHQPLMYEYFVERLYEVLPATAVSMLDTAPVTGAVALAHGMLGTLPGPAAAETTPVYEAGEMT